MYGLVWISWMREKTGIIIMSTKNMLTSLWWTLMKYVRGSTVYWCFYQSLDTSLNIERMLLHDYRDQCDNCKLFLTSQPMHKLLNCKLVCKIILLKLLLRFLESNKFFSLINLVKLSLPGGRLGSSSPIDGADCGAQWLTGPDATGWQYKSIGHLHHLHKRS